MKLLADEGVDVQIVNRLRADGHEVVYVAEVDPGITDDEVLLRANQEEALLLTTDKDFGELIVRLRRIHAGVILIRLEGITASQKAAVVSEALSRHTEGLSKSFTVISPGLLRIRRTG